MPTLQGRKPKDTYGDLLQVSNANSGMDATLRNLEDGEGSVGPIQLSTSTIAVPGGKTLDVNGNLALAGATLTENLPMGTNRITGLAAATARTDAPQVGQVQDGAFTWCGTAAGSANALTLNPSPAITAYAAGQRFRFVGAADNTDATTAAISGLTARDVQVGGSALSGGEILTGELYELFDDGTRLQLSRITPSTIGHALMQAATQAAAQAAIGATSPTEADGLVPVGTPLPFAGQGLSANWLFCNGQNVLRAQWPQLFARLGTIFGAGDGSTTFGLPDLRGRVVAGLDAMAGSGSANRLSSILASTTLGAVGGVQTVALTTNELPAHDHLIANADDINQELSAPGGGAEHLVLIRATGGSSSYALGGSNTEPTRGLTSAAGNGAAFGNTQPTMVLNMVIFAGEEVPQS